MECRHSTRYGVFYFIGLSLIISDLIPSDLSSFERRIHGSDCGVKRRSLPRLQIMKGDITQHRLDILCVVMTMLQYYHLFVIVAVFDP